MNKWIEVRHVMTRDLITAKETETLSSVREKILEHNIQHIPVVEGKKIVGMISLAHAARSYDDMIKVIRVFNRVFAPGGGQTG